MQDDTLRSQPEDMGVDVTADSPLPDIPDAGADSQPLNPPEPIDISTATINADAALVSGTFGDPRTMYEQALDAYEASDGDVSASADPGKDHAGSGRRTRIYEVQR